MGACCGVKKNNQKAPVVLETKRPKFIYFIENHESYTSSYKIIGKIGEGATGHVKSVKCRFTKIHRAMKSIKINSERALTKAQKELSILKKLDYPTIVRSIESFQDNDFLHIVTEVYKGPTVYDVLKEGNGLGEKKAYEIMHQILLALNYIHRLKIMHRDLKPENLIFESENPDSLLKLIDFGSAKFIKKNFSKKKSGTLYYMSPQVIDGNYSEKCDVWSAGIIFYILVSGNHPFYSDNDQDLLEKIRKLPVHFRSSKWQNISYNTKEIIGKMLEKKEKHRPFVAELLAMPYFQTQKFEIPAQVSDVIGHATVFKVFNEVYRCIINAALLRSIDSIEYSKIFLVLDKDSDGKVTKKDLSNFVSVSPDDNSIFSEFPNFYLSFSDFMICYTKWSEILTEKTAMQIFKYFDKDKDGNVSVEDFRNFQPIFTTIDYQKMNHNEDKIILIDQGIFNSFVETLI